jgi:hypothetical protein
MSGFSSILATEIHGHSFTKKPADIRKNHIHSYQKFRHEVQKSRNFSEEQAPCFVAAQERLTMRTSQWLMNRFNSRDASQLMLCLFFRFQTKQIVLKQGHQGWLSVNGGGAIM